METLTHATNLIAQGYTHLQFKQGGCIKKIKSKDGYYYGIKNGNGTGKVLRKFSTLKESLESLKGYGWGEIVSWN